jgi:uncharacterized membrane protein YhhN
MVALIVLVFVVALLDWTAVAKGWQKVEYFTKPAVMVLLLAWLALTGFSRLPLLFFALAIFFSLGGDVFLMLPDTSGAERWFIPGLASFLLAHLAYLAALNIPLPEIAAVWSLVLAVVLALAASRILRRIIKSMREKGQGRMAPPVGIYGIVITLMLLSAMLTLSNPEWKAGPAALVAFGAAFFYFSDIILAWNKFVTPTKNGRVINMVLYHLGQIALVAGAILQFGK